MTPADWIIVGVVFVSVVHAASAGFFHEAFGIAGLVFGYLLAAWQYRQLAQRFAPYVNSPWFGEITAFLIIFIAVMVLAGIAGRITRWAVKEAGLSFVDRLLGAALGLLRGCLMVAVVLTSMAAFTPTSKWLEGSEIAPYFRWWGGPPFGWPHRKCGHGFIRDSTCCGTNSERCNAVCRRFGGVPLENIGTCRRAVASLFREREMP